MKKHPPRDAWRKGGAPRSLHKGPPRSPSPPPAPSPFRPVGPDLVALYGFHSVREALRAKRRKLLALFATEAAASRLASDIAASDCPVTLVDAAALDARLGREAVHQGVLLESRALPALDIADVADRGGTLLVLDQITDPHNVGAILRTAAAFAVRGVVLTDRHAPALDGVLAKAASGGLEHVAVVAVVNLARALDEIGELGFRRIGLDSDAGTTLGTALDGQPTALVLGGEGAGLRRLTRERCDVLARLDLPGAIRSLNVSNACAIALSALQTRGGQG